MTDNETIRNRIASIYRLSIDPGETEGEIAIAKLKLEELLNKYGLTLDDLEKQIQFVASEYIEP